MMELAGIDMLPPEAGVPLIRRELTAGSTAGEIVIGQRLGILLKEWDEPGGIDPDAVTAAGNLAFATPGPMVGQIIAAGAQGGFVVETRIDPAVQPFLHDHKLDGIALLPGVMGIEAFAEAVLSIAPGWRVEAVENVDFLAPLKFYRNEPRTVTIEFVVRPDGRNLAAECKLIGRRTLANQREPQETTHFTGRVRLTRQAAAAAAVTPPGAPAGPIVEAAEIYRVFFHGPAYRVLNRAWRDGDRVIGLWTSGLPNDHQPAGRPLYMAPRLIELCFQTCGIWELDSQSRAGLPEHVDRVCVCRPPELAEGSLYAVVKPCPDQRNFDAEVVDSLGNRYVLLSGYRTIALHNAIDSGPLKPLKAVIG
jgi:hypothetical protein